MYLEILGEARKKHSVDGHDMRSPVETYVLVLMLSSEVHDYIQTDLLNKGAGKQFVWYAFIKYLKDFDHMLQVYCFQDPDTYSGELCYSLDLRVLTHFVDCIYTCKKASDETRAKNFPSMEVLRKIASQAVWTLQYLSNGVFPHRKVVDGTAFMLSSDEKPVKLSLYGFSKKGWAKRMYHASKFHVSCPPILRKENEET